MDIVWHRISGFYHKQMKKLIFTSLDLCEELYRMYAKSKAFGVWRKAACKNRTYGHLASRITKCSADETHLEKYCKNLDKKRKAKQLTRFNSSAEI